MFTDFFYTLRGHDVDVSLTEWLTLLTALEKGLARNSLTEFYYVSRAVLAKSEQDYDNFDAAFLACFGRSQEAPALDLADLADSDRPVVFFPQERRAQEAPDGLSERSEGERISTRAALFLHDASGQGAAGSGAGGMDGDGSMVGGAASKSAFDLAGSRTFRDFRNDTIINERQFQVVLRRLRQLSNHIDTPETELDINGTIRKTSDKGGLLHVVMQKPRKNTVKLMLLMDSGGSMQGYTKFCAALFRAATKSNTFQDLKIYYFHNCIYNKLYHDPTCSKEASSPTKWVLQNIGGEYKVIIVGDASMAPYELFNANYQGERDEQLLSGAEWMRLFKKQYRKIVWLNPEEVLPWWDERGQKSTRKWFASEFDMSLFTLKNFETAMKKLLAG